MVAGTELGADVASDGRYSIDAVPPGTYRLRARLIGHALMEMTSVVVTAGDTARADFRLAPLAVTLQEVVVVGYGTQARKDITGSVASVAGEDLQRTPKANAIDAIKGRVPGVDIVTTGNKPGDGISIRVRGERRRAVLAGGDRVAPGGPVDGLAGPRAAGRHADQQRGARNRRRREDPLRAQRQPVQSARHREGAGLRATVGTAQLRPSLEPPAAGGNLDLCAAQRPAPRQGRRRVQ